MKIKRRTKIIIETERKISVVNQRGSTWFFCPVCECQSEWLSINQAARQLKIRWREVIHSIEKGEFQFIETEKGEIYICSALKHSKNF